MFLINILSICGVSLKTGIRLGRVYSVNVKSKGEHGLPLSFTSNVLLYDTTFCLKFQGLYI